MYGKIFMNKKTTMQLLAAGALLALAGMANAQYVWVDQKGMKQFSDQPPPSSVPLKNILRAPAKPALNDAVDDMTRKPAAAAASAPMSVVERDADFRKRAKDKADADAKSATAAADQALKKSNCDAARARVADLATGKRIRDNTPQRAFLDEPARAAKMAEAQQVLSQCN